MIPFRTVPIPTKIAESVRHTLRAPGYGHRAELEIAAGFGPCRHCLQGFEEGEEGRILFTYDPFTRHGARPLPGPIFIHADACERYPGEGGVPDGLNSYRSSLLAYAGERVLLAENHQEGDRVEAAIRHLLAMPNVQYVHMRNEEAGCFTAAFEPAEALESAVSHCVDA